VSRLGFSSADPNDVWIGGRDRHVTDGKCRLLLEYGRPCDTIVGCLPEVARAGAQINDSAVSGRAGDGLYAPTLTRRPQGSLSEVLIW
jgi:hypothetical protein